MTPRENLRQQLEMWVRVRQRHELPEHLRFACIEDLVMQHGLEFERSLVPPPIQPIAKACFAQAYRLATRKNSEWVYCEGYAVGKIGLAVLHAWVTRADHLGTAYEVAWADPGENTAYIGIPFQTEFVRKTHLASKREFYSVLDTWWQDYPLITGKTRIEDVVWSRLPSHRAGTTAESITKGEQ